MEQINAVSFVGQEDIGNWHHALDGWVQTLENEEDQEDIQRIPHHEVH